VQLSAEELAQRIADLRARLPQHSVPAAMLMELEDLEEELALRWREQGGAPRRSVGAGP
jgi:hypothetical protein